MQIIKDAMSEINQLKTSQQLLMENYENIADITLRFVTAISVKPEKLQEYYPHWASEMDKAMRVEDSERITELFNTIHKLFINLEKEN